MSDQLTGTQVHAAVNECSNLHGIGPDFPKTWLDTNMDFNELAKALNKRLPASAPSDQLRKALQDIYQYWNGRYNEKAMSDALDHIVQVAEAALALPQQPPAQESRAHMAMFELEDLPKDLPKDGR
jgi:hypothetical protein